MKLRRLLKYYALTGIFTLASASTGSQSRASSTPASDKKTALVENTTSVLQDTLRPTFKLSGLDKVGKDSVAEDLAKKNYKYASITVDAASGEILSGAKVDKQLHPASTTKLMTAYLVFEALEKGDIQLDQKLTVTARAATMEWRLGVKKSVGKKTVAIGLRTGGSITLEEALQGAMIKSANDVTILLGTAVSGSEKTFIDRMNEKAAELGMTDTHFVNTNGLPYDLTHNAKTKNKSTQSHTTVADMTMLMHAILTDYPQYYHYLSETSFVFESKGHPLTGYTIGGHNRMLDPNSAIYSPYIDGGKTGWIAMSGSNLVASAVKDGKRIIAVVFGASSDANRGKEMNRIINNAFKKLETEKTYYYTPGDTLSNPFKDIPNPLLPELLKPIPLRPF